MQGLDDDNDDGISLISETLWNGDNTFYNMRGKILLSYLPTHFKWNVEHFDFEKQAEMSLY